MSEKNTLSSAVVNTFTALMEDIHTCLPGRVEDYDFRTSKATVKPLIQKTYIDGETLILPILKEVPVVFPRTGSSGITFPVNRGDRVLSFFSERSLDSWYTTGLDAVPGDNRKFDMSDSMCIPGLYSFNERNIASNNNDLEVHHEGQKITIKKNGNVEVGTGILTKLVNDTFKTLYNAHTHLDPVSGVSGTPVVPMTDLQLTSKVKAE